MEGGRSPEGGGDKLLNLMGKHTLGQQAAGSTPAGVLRTSRVALLRVGSLGAEAPFREKETPFCEGGGLWKGKYFGAEKMRARRPRLVGLPQGGRGPTSGKV